MNLILAHAVFAEKRGAEQAVKRLSSGSWNGKEKSTPRSPQMPPESSDRLRSGARYPDSIIHPDGWRGYNGPVDMGYKKHFRVHPGENEFAAVIAISMALDHSGHMPNEDLQSSTVFPEKRFIYTSRNVSLDFITERKISLDRILTLLRENPL